MLIIHGAADTLVVPRQADLLYEAAWGGYAATGGGAEQSTVPTVGGEADGGWILDLATGEQ